MEVWRTEDLRVNFEKRFMHYERGIYGFYSKTAPFIDFTLSFRF